VFRNKKYFVPDLDNDTIDDAVRIDEGKIRKIQDLIDFFGGEVSDWRKMEGYAPDGSVWHWYQKGGRKKRKIYGQKPYFYGEDSLPDPLPFRAD